MSKKEKEKRTTDRCAESLILTTVYKMIKKNHLLNRTTISLSHLVCFSVENNIYNVPSVRLVVVTLKKNITSALHAGPVIVFKLKFEDL